MKYTTKELFEMPIEDLERICGCNCMTKDCPFKKSLWKYRIDGYCIRQTYQNINKWCDNDDTKILRLKIEIKFLENDIKALQKSKKAIDKELSK